MLHFILQANTVVATVADILKKYGIRQIRLPEDRALLISTKAPLVLFSMLNRPKLEKLGFESMDCFYPQVSHFRDHGRFRARISFSPHSEVIVHPAESNDIAALEFSDSYQEGRVLEYQALKVFECLGTLGPSA